MTEFSGICASPQTHGHSFYSCNDSFHWYKKIQLFKLYYSHWSDLAACLVGQRDILVIRCFRVFTDNMWFFSVNLILAYCFSKCMLYPCACPHPSAHAWNFWARAHTTTPPTATTWPLKSDLVKKHHELWLYQDPSFSPEPAWCHSNICLSDAFISYLSNREEKNPLVKHYGRIYGVKIIIIHC